MQKLPVNKSSCYAIALIYDVFFNSLSLKAFENSNKCQVKWHVSLQIFPWSIYLVLVTHNWWVLQYFNNNNNVPIYEHFHISWYTKQLSNLFSDQRWCLLAWTRQSQSLRGEWNILMVSVMASNYTMFVFTLAAFSL